jgi:hypothetical protein
MDSSLYEFGGLAANGAGLDDVPAHLSGTPPRRTGTPVVGVIHNPRSHRNRGRLADSQTVPGVLAASPKGRPALTEALARFAEARIELLVIDGGDGTVREVLTCGAAVFGARWPRLMVLPKGKTNALTVDLGMPKRMTLAEAVAAAGTARAVTRRPILIDQPDAAGREVMGFILGTGVFNVAIEAGQVAHRFGAFQGLAVGVTTAVGVLQALFGLGPTPWRRSSRMHMTCGSEGREVPRSRHGDSADRFGGGFSTLASFPLGLRPFGRVTGEGAIRYVLMDAPLRRVVALVPLLLAGFDRPFLAGLGIHRGAADEIRFDLGAGFILDGEAFPAGRYRLRPGPELTFLVP